MAKLRITQKWWTMGTLYSISLSVKEVLNVSYHNLEGRPSLISSKSAFILVKTHGIARYKSNVILGYTQRVLAFIFTVFFLRCLVSITKQGWQLHSQPVYIPHNQHPSNKIESQSVFFTLYKLTIFIKHTCSNPSKFLLQS